MKASTFWQKRTAQLHLSNLFERGLAVLDCYILKLLKSFTENITLKPGSPCHVDPWRVCMNEGR